MAWFYHSYFSDLRFCYTSHLSATSTRAVLLLIKQGKESACNAGDLGSIPELGRSPGEGNSNPFQYFAWKISWTEETGRLVGSQIVGHDWVMNTHTHTQSSYWSNQPVLFLHKGPSVWIFFPHIRTVCFPTFLGLYSKSPSLTGLAEPSN